MQQHLMQMQPMMAAYYPSNVTTDHIQQYLDENKSLILKIVESQNSGKLSECAENQARLQRNLMYLAAIADSQPQPPTMPGQYSSGGGMMQMQMQMQQGTQYMQGQQMTHQQLMAARSSLLYAQQPYSALQQHQQALHSQLAMTSAPPLPSLHTMLPSEPASPFPEFVRSAKPDIGTSAPEGRAEGGETLYLKTSDDAN